MEVREYELRPQRPRGHIEQTCPVILPVSQQLIPAWIPDQAEKPARPPDRRSKGSRPAVPDARSSAASEREETTIRTKRQRGDCSGFVEALNRFPVREAVNGQLIRSSGHGQRTAVRTPGRRRDLAQLLNPRQRRCRVHVPDEQLAALRQRQQVTLARIERQLLDAVPGVESAQGLRVDAVPNLEAQAVDPLSFRVVAGQLGGTGKPQGGLSRLALIAGEQTEIRLRFDDLRLGFAMGLLGLGQGDTLAFSANSAASRSCRRLLDHPQTAGDEDQAA